jgi:hypothetical protein
VSGAVVPVRPGIVLAGHKLHSASDAGRRWNVCKESEGEDLEHDRHRSAQSVSGHVQRGSS